MSPINADSFPQITPNPQHAGANLTQTPTIVPNQNISNSKKRAKLAIIFALILLFIAVISTAVFLLNKVNKDAKTMQEAKQKEAEANKRTSTITVKNDYERIGEPATLPYTSNNSSSGVSKGSSLTYGVLDDRKYYSLFIPTNWTKNEQSLTLTASDSSSVRNIKIVLGLYSQKFVDTWKNAAEYKKELNVDHARFLTPECHLEDNFCTRTHFIWNESQQKFATLTVQWEKAPQTANNSQNVIETDPGVYSFESNLFRNFKFK